jgi:hypothetical protein
MQTDGIPDDMKALVRSSVSVAERVARTVGGTHATWTPVAYRLVLAAILRDWSDNGTSQLVDEDVTNLEALVAEAANAAEEGGSIDRDATFEIVLQGLLVDWVENWSDDAAAAAEDDDDEGAEA